MDESKIETEYKLFTAEVAVPYYYANAGNQIINIVAKNIEEALEVAKQYALESHVILRVINNDAKTIYMLKEEK